MIGCDPVVFDASPCAVVTDTTVKWTWTTRGLPVRMQYAEWKVLVPAAVVVLIVVVVVEVVVVTGPLAFVAHWQISAVNDAYKSKRCATSPGRHTSAMDVTKRSRNRQPVSGMARLEVSTDQPLRCSVQTAPSHQR